MTLKRDSSKRQQSVGSRRLRFFCVLILTVTVVAPFPLAEAASPAVTLIRAATQSLSLLVSSQQNPVSKQDPQRATAPRISVLINETREIPLATAMTSVLVVSTEIASAEVKLRVLKVTGLHAGETILIAFAGQTRYTFLVEVLGRTYANTHQKIQPTDASTAELSRQSVLSGSYSLSYSAPFSSAPTVLRQNFDFQRKLGERTFRFSSDMFKFMGAGNVDGVQAKAPGFGLNRLSLGIDGPSGAFDILDSQINVSLLSFNNYTMRGFHVVSAKTSALRGAELFAGQARPSLSLFEMNQGRVMGIVLPVAGGEFWSVRAGVFAVSPQQNNALASGGTVWQVNARYSPSNDTAAEGELAYANGGVSWRTKIDLRRGPVDAHAEILRFDRRSPLISVGAQAGGRQMEAFAIQWRPSGGFSAGLAYNHTATTPPATARRSTLGTTTLLANASYRINQNSRLGFRYTQQQIETGPPVGPRFRLETRTATFTHDIRLKTNWANSFQARMSSSRETSADAQTDSGLSIGNQLRFSSKRGSATGFINYTRQQSSIAGLISRNPQLLPPLLQRAFAVDPAEFLRANRNTLALLLPGVELPQTRGLDAGLRLQTAFSRVNVAAEVRYSASEIVAQEQRNVVASLSTNMRLDAANSIRVSGSRSFGLNTPGGQSALTISYVHRFGAGSSGGFQFSRLLGLERGLIQGRVFFDLNGNGQDDPDEAGVAGQRVQIDGDRSTTTDARGRFRFQINAGEYNVAMISEELGVAFAASTATEQHVSLGSRQTVNVSFGLSNYGSVAGRVFNDLFLEGLQTAGTFPGIGGIRVSLRPAMTSPRATLSLIADAGGKYQFRNLTPGTYTLEIDATTLPPDFRVLHQTSWLIKVAPLQTSYLDIPLSAQRAIAGIVFIDKDGDGKFDLQKDETVEGARLIYGKTEVNSGSGGRYILRNLPSGRIEVRARASWGKESNVVIVELGEAPIRRINVNLLMTR